MRSPRKTTPPARWWLQTLHVQWIKNQFWMRLTFGWPSQKLVMSGSVLLCSVLCRTQQLVFVARVAMILATGEGGFLDSAVEWSAKAWPTRSPCNSRLHPQWYQFMLLYKSCSAPHGPVTCLTLLAGPTCYTVYLLPCDGNSYGIKILRMIRYALWLVTQIS
jgi:hypothetical protein